MNKFLFIILFLFFSIHAYNQSAFYGNEWIHTDQKYLKCYITKEGIYRIDYSTLNASLAAMGESLSSIDPRNFQIFNSGLEQDIYVEGENDGVFDAGDFIEFYGNKNDGKFDSHLYEDPLNQQSHTYSSLFNDTAAYFLTWNASLLNKRFSVELNDLTGAPAAESFCKYENVTVFGAKVDPLQFCDGPSYSEVFSSKFEAGEGFAGYKYNNATLPFTITTNEFYTGVDAFIPTLETVLITSNPGLHQCTIKWNDVIYEDTSFYESQFIRLNYSLDNLLSSNTITYISSSTFGDWQRYPYLKVEYPRNYSFDFLSQINFEISDNPAAQRLLVLSNYDEKSTSPLLYDFDAHKRMTGIVEGADTKFLLNYEATSHHIFVSSQDASDVSLISTLIPIQFIDYSLEANQGDFLIITHPYYFNDGSGTNWVENYRSYRNSFSGGGFNAKTIDINQLYDQFAYGIHKHPLAIRNFALYAADTFSIKPKYLLLIGRGFMYNYSSVYTDYNALNYIPTFGSPGSDNLLVSEPGSIVPAISVGRISAANADELRRYYEKVVEYEAVQADPVQTIENKAWMKNVLHFAGGLSDFEQDLFDDFLNQYAVIIEDTLYGGHVKQFNKTSTDPILYSTSDYVDSLINNGASLLTFFGHAAAGSFDYNIGDPDDFTNEGKYHVVFSNGCNTNAIYGLDPTLSEQFVFADHKAAVAFIASSTFSLAGALYPYGITFYQELSSKSYPLGLGDIIKNTNNYFSGTGTVYDRLVQEHTTLLGDPSLHLNPHALPDYAIEPASISFDPPFISTAIDSFTINIHVSNLGKAIDTSYFVEVVRHKPDGTTETFLNRYDAAYWMDTIKIKMFTDAIDGVGYNGFDIHIDNVNELAELDELNNILSTNTYITSQDAIPIYPYEYAIVNHIPDHLTSSTADLFASEKQFVIEIDTTEFFNSPLKKTKHLLGSGGVIDWEHPEVTWIDSTVYYWRISLDTLYDNTLIWRTSSFIYKSGIETGWNQSHYFQYLNDQFENILLPENRNFEFVQEEKSVSVATGIDPATPWYEVTSYINGELIATGSCASNGFVIFVFDPSTGEPWTTHEVGTTNFGPYGDVYCSGDASKKYLQFNTNDLTNRTAMYNFMNTIPDSAYIVCYTNNYAEFNEWMDDAAVLGGNGLFDKFTELGAVEILSLATYDADRSYIFGAKKGNLASAYEIISDEFGNKIDATFSVFGYWNTGNIYTEIIGPAASWDKVKWKFHTYDTLPTDINSVTVIGITADGIEVPYYSNLISGDTSIADISAEAFPYLKLKVNSTDDSLRTPPQIDYLRVVYLPVPESALNPSFAFSLSKDTVQVGEDISLQIAIKNVSELDMDSLLIKYSLVSGNNSVYAIPYLRQDSLKAGETMLSNLSFNTKNYPAGLNTLFIEVNPNNDQPEQYHWNNLGYIRIYSAPDLADPLFDVTFDGVHILNGDLVSAEPFIEIALKDENTFLALNDTNYLQVQLKFPDGSLHSFLYDNTFLKFYPADENNLAETNTARVEFNPGLLEDGIYQLILHGQDASGNESGNDLDYMISFEVINKPMISNVFNYPNPFTTQTKFVFTLTGSEVPEYFKIQIMTISGKVIREIMRNELGELHIGNNITEFSWDGTDAFGDEVANGLYLYRVVTKLNGKELDNYDTGTDSYFNNGWGKMYLAR